MNTGAVGQAQDNTWVSAYAETEKTTGKSRVSGRTVGDPELSEKGKAYYEELQKKFGNLDFILVDSDIKDQVDANAGAYANSSRMVVLIDTDKIERMAEDEEYRKKYEGIISNAQTQMAQVKNSLTASGVKVKSFGIKVDDGGISSYFAVIDESLEKQRERIEEKQETKIKERREAQKKAYQERWQKGMDETAEAGRPEKSEGWKPAGRSESDVTVTAGSVEELIQKIQDHNYERMSDSVWTEAEKQVGWNIDFRG